MIKTRWLRLVRALGLAQALLRGCRPGVTGCQLQGGKHLCPIRLVWAGKVCQRYLSLEELLFPTTFRGSLRVWRFQQHFQETLGAHMQLWEMSQTVWSQTSAIGVR